jgi:hypothetical protein
MRAMIRGDIRHSAHQGFVPLAFAAIFACSMLLVPTLAFGQTFSIGSGQLRPFVTALIPVVGRSGFVGGVSVDSEGVVARSDVETLGRLRDARRRALGRIDSELHIASPLRKISLRGLVAEIDARRRAGRPISDELQYLAGLQRVELVLVYPEHHDIVLAGFAEGWRVDEQGNVVGQTRGQPVLQLDDLIVALRTAKNALTEEGITCSIDPTKEGTQRLQRLFGTRGLQMNETTIARIEETLGPQTITLTGIPAGSHFAYVLAAADLMLKRLGMNLEPAPIPGMPSYMELLQEPSAPAPRNTMPRFWLAPRYDPLLKDSEGLAWQLRGTGVQALAEDGVLRASGISTVSSAKESNTPATKWAETMTAKYDALSTAMPIFKELRNCMDLAVVAALFAKEDLPKKAGCDLSLFLDEKRIQVANYHVPKTVLSRASVIPKGRQWIVGISGGVAVDSWSVLNHVELNHDLAKTRERTTSVPAGRWWWD